MSTQHSPFAAGLLKELAREESNLIMVNEEYRRVKATFDVASRKYAAVRDMVISELISNPYSDDSALQYMSEAVGFGVEHLGHFRFMHMKPGDAVVAALKEVQEPITLMDIMVRLSRGGFQAADAMRMINAALMRTSGINKTEDGKYELEEPEPEDLPF